MKRSDMVRKMAAAHSSLDFQGKSYDYDELARHMLSVIEEAGMQPPNTTLDKLVPGFLKDNSENIYYACWEPEDNLTTDDLCANSIADIEALIDEDKELMKILQEMEKKLEDK
jgi:hypothetical protein